MVDPFFLAVGIWVVAFVGILLEWTEKSVITLLGGLLMVLFGILTPNEAIEVIGFSTLILLMGMMVLVDVMRRTGMFSWINISVAKLTRGKPWLIFALFLTITAVSSSLLNSVSTVLLMIPITLALVKGLGLNARYFTLGIILFANIGGSLTLIGDPANVLIGTQAGLSFNDFFVNLYQPIALVFVFVLFTLGLLNWQELKPISHNLQKLFTSHLMIHTIKLRFLKTNLSRSFIVKCLLVFLLTISGFIFQQWLGLPVYIIALSGAVLLLLLTSHQVSVPEVLKEVEWSTLLFFAGLFVMVGGLEQVGLLEQIAHLIQNFSGSFISLLLIVLWGSAIVSAVLDNVAFVAIMIPVIVQLQSHYVGTENPQLLFWALSLGAILGGSGTLIGSSANLVSISIARRFGVEISFLSYLKTAFPIMIGMLLICSAYFYFLIL